MKLFDLSKIKYECINSLLNFLKITLREATIETNQIILFVLKIDTSQLLLKETININQYEKIKKIISIRSTGKPLAYIFNEWSFYGRTFYLNSSMLIPRPETELIIDLLKEKKLVEDNMTILDLGAGSGVIGISAKLEIDKKINLHLSDISKRCVLGIKKNLQKFNLDAKVYLSDWFTKIPKIKFDLIISNPPYIYHKEPHLIKLNFEPKIALISKKNGLADINNIIKNSIYYLRNGGSIIIEHGYNQKDEVQEILNRYNFIQVESFKDLLGHFRITKGIFS